MWQEQIFRVALAREGTTSLTAPEEELEAARQWMADNLLALREALRPYLDDLMRAENAVTDKVS